MIYSIADYETLQTLLLDPEEMIVEDFEKIREIPGVLLILCMATYGEGDPPDNAQEFYQHILNTSLNLTGVNFAVSLMMLDRIELTNLTYCRNFVMPYLKRIF